MSEQTEQTNPADHCAECAYLQAERAGMCIDSHMPEDEAVKVGLRARCWKHQEKEGER